MRKNDLRNNDDYNDDDNDDRNDDDDDDDKTDLSPTRHAKGKRILTKKKT